MAVAPTNKELADSITRRRERTRQVPLLVRTLIRVLIPLARSAPRADDNVVVLAFGIAAYSYSAGLHGQFSLTEIRRFRQLVQNALKEEHRSPLANRVAFALDYFLEAAQSEFSDSGAVRRSFEAFLDLNPQLNAALRADNDTSPAISAEPGAHYLMPLQAADSAMKVVDVTSAVLARGEDWRPWALWLRDRFAGGSFYKLNTRFYATIPAALWPVAARVNGWLVGVTPSIENRPLEEAPYQDASEPNVEDIDVQEPTSISFTIIGGGQVHLDKEAGQSSLLDQQLNHDLHQELVEKVVALEAICASSNSLAALAVAISRFRDSLGQSPLTLSPAPAVLRGNALRKDLEVDLSRRGKEDPDVPPLPEGVAGSLKELVEAWNIYVGCDPYLDRMDSRRLGPDERPLRKLLPDELSHAIDSAEREKLATEDAISILRETEAVAQNTTIAADRALAFQLGTMRNFARSVFRLALKNKAAIGGAFLLAVKWTHSNADLLRGLLSGYPNLIAILDWLLEATRFLLL